MCVKSSGKLAFPSVSTELSSVHLLLARMACYCDRRPSILGPRTLGGVGVLHIQIWRVKLSNAVNHTTYNDHQWA